MTAGDGAGMTGGAAALLVLLGTVIVAYTAMRWKRTIRSQSTASCSVIEMPGSS